MYKGLLLRASAGTFFNPKPAGDFQALNCDNTTNVKSAITHNSNSLKAASAFNVSWTAPATGGPVVFGAIVVGQRASLSSCTYAAHEATINIATAAPTPAPVAPTVFTFTTAALVPQRVQAVPASGESPWTGLDSATIATNDDLAASSTLAAVGKTAPLYLSDFKLAVPFDGLRVSGIAATLARNATGGPS